jgi:hypothetical protein
MEEEGILVRFGGTFFRAATLKDAVLAMIGLFHITRKFNDDFNISINLDRPGAAWSINRGEHGYLFALTVDEPVNGFGEHLPGRSYAYKVGDDPVLVDHPAIELLKVQRHCFVSREVARELVAGLRHVDAVDKSGGFVFDPAHWQPIG